MQTLLRPGSWISYGPGHSRVAPSGSQCHLRAKVPTRISWLWTPDIYRVSGPSGEMSVAVNAPLLPAQRMTVNPDEAAGIDKRAVFAPRDWIFGDGWFYWQS